MREIKRDDDGTTMKLLGGMMGHCLGYRVMCFIHTGSKVSENEGFTNGRESRRSV